MDELHIMIAEFIERHQNRRRIARGLRLFDVTRIVIPHAVRLNINFANVIVRAYIRAWKG